MQSYQTVPVQNMIKFVSSKEQRTILWLDQQRQLHFVDQDLQEYLLTCKSNRNFLECETVLFFSTAIESSSRKK